MELYIFARLHAREGQEANVEQAIREVLAPTRKEAAASTFTRFARFAMRGCFTFTRDGKTKTHLKRTSACRILGSSWNAWSA